MQNPTPQQLIARAFEAARFTYSPYSRFPVGAALLCADGSVVTGTNVENRSFGLTNCAERSALFAAVSMGKRDFTAIAVACPDAEQPVGPCGACRQALSEFCPPDMPVHYAGKNGKPVTTTIGELLPADSLHGLKEGLPRAPTA
ncbi:MAG: cytidine deaminase [Spirochaetia bacterium]|jgi:cytidine deaminase